MLRKILAVVFLVIFLIFSPKAFAAEEFATSYNVAYDVAEDGVTTVTEKIILRNLTEQYYAERFKLTIGATQISDVQASDPGGSMVTSSEQQGTSTTILVKFNVQIAGVNKELPWTLRFKSKDFAEKHGRVWEIRTPKISSTTNLDSYNATVLVPLSFGEPTSISPAPKSQTIAFGKRVLNFDKDQLTESGVSANFGNFQLFDFDLTYHLENPGIVSSVTNIALPPDTAYQEIIYKNIDPKPVNVTVDRDGNYLAWYRLTKNQKLDVRVRGAAKLYINSKVKNPVLPPALQSRYTTSQKYWEKENPTITTKLAEILGPNPPTSNRERAKLIYRYVVGDLKYDSSRLESGLSRIGAVAALNNPSNAVCMEFTDLFIALARAANIPSRELNGYAFSANTTLRPLSLSQDILHAWPEYWDEEKGWVMVDPTWENTTGGVDYFNKFDLNHLVFAIKGFSSEEPLPAGSYKYTGQDSQDVKVTLSESEFSGKPQIQVDINIPKPVIAGFPQKMKLKVSNTGSTFFPSYPLSITAQNLLILGDTKEDLGPIPPFGYGEFEFDLRSKSLLDSFNDQIVVSIGALNFNQKVSVAPFIESRYFLPALGGLVSLVVGVYLVILGALIYRKRFNIPKKP